MSYPWRIADRSYARANQMYRDSLSRCCCRAVGPPNTSAKDGDRIYLRLASAFSTSARAARAGAPEEQPARLLHQLLH
jgi:hypothetical protein